MIEALIITAGILITRFALPPPKGLRLIAWVNLGIFVVFSIGFSRMTGASVAGVDAMKFYRLASIKTLGELDGLSQANFVYFLSNKIQSVVPLSYTAFNLFAAVFFSHMALLLIMRRLENPSRRLVIFWWLLTLLPGFHFWHASFGKESIQLLLIAAYFSFSSLAIRGGSILLLSMVRPHIALAIGMGEVIANIFSKKVTFQRVFIIAGGAAIALSGLTYLINRVSGGDGVLNFAQVWQLFQDYGSNWREGDLRFNNTSSIFAPVEFLLRPYFWEVSGPVLLFSWFDSLVATLFGVFILIRVTAREKLKAPWLFAVLVTLLLAVTNPNVGTSHRKKQILPIAAMIVMNEAFLRRRERSNRRSKGKVTLIDPKQIEYKT